ncbi:tRNA dihydrouridine synthase DusB [Desulfosarcina sp. OttesenSCG-928-G10]|nr:tRNA dihydrouridine synthase DusB [Desulfosarcina sp. OttesenSCG-928-G10]
MKIGTVEIHPKTVFAPLAGITHLPMRLLAKKAGCGLVCSEMISSNGLVYGAEKTIRLMDTDPAEKPLSVQIFGANPAIMAAAARRVQDAGADILDINFGCSVKKILKSQSGAALMRDPALAASILAAVRKAVTIPLTLKIRSGWDASGRQALEIAKIAEDCGADAIAVHPRTAPQGFGGRADWNIIAAVKNTVTIPVIGNGDVNSAQDALRLMAQTGCDAVMVGRAAVGNPMIFSQIQAAVEGRDIPEITDADRIRAMTDYVAAAVRYLGEDAACRILRSRLCWFVKGMRNAGQFRQSIRFLASEKEALDRIREYAGALAERSAGREDGRAQADTPEK